MAKTSFLKRALLAQNKKERVKQEYVSFSVEFPQKFNAKSILDLGRNFGSDEFRDKLLLAVFAAYVNQSQSCKDKKEKEQVASRIAEDFFDFFWQSVGQQIYVTAKNFPNLNQEILDDMMKEMNRLKPLEKIDAEEDSST